MLKLPRSCQFLERSFTNMGTASSDCLSRQSRVLHSSLFNPGGCTQKNEEPTQCPFRTAKVVIGIPPESWLHERLISGFGVMGLPDCLRCGGLRFRV